MSDEELSKPVPIELSDQELEQVSGGYNLFLSGSMFEQNEAMFSQEGGFGRTRSGRSLRQRQTAASAFQIAVTGIDSFSDLMSVFRGFASLFGKRF